MKRFPKFIPVNLTVGLFYHNWKRFDESLTLVKSVSDRFKSVEVCYNLAHLYHDVGMYKQAVEQFNLASEIEGPPETILQKLSACYNQMNL